MATIAPVVPDAEQRERRFFLVMALAIAAAVVGGFGIRLLLGVTSFATSPWWTHVHAVSFMAWTGFYVLQNWLVARGEIGQHRALGRIGAVAALWVCFVGLALTWQTLATGSAPPFFAPGYFLAQNWLFIVFFAGLTYGAIALRHRPDWHKRLMLCATLVVSLPGFARWIILLAPPPDALKHLVSFAVFFVPAMAFDLATRRSIHPAYLVGGGAILFLEVAAIKLLAAFPPFAALAKSIAG
jgi:hypothetical protein